MLSEHSALRNSARHVSGILGCMVMVELGMSSQIYQNLILTPTTCYLVDFEQGTFSLQALVFLSAKGFFLHLLSGINDSYV